MPLCYYSYLLNSKNNYVIKDFVNSIWSSILVWLYKTIMVQLVENPIKDQVDVSQLP